jgi:hypothetical protein
MAGQFTLNLKPPESISLLDLPWEVRESIYIHALVSPVRWDRNHDALCKWATRDSVSHPTPPFDVYYQKQCENRTDLAKVFQCSCAKRLGLGLLRLNKQIHMEAAPIFWSRNTHCFYDWEDFADLVGARLREEYRLLIQRISVMPVNAQNEYGYLHPFWDTIYKCTGLRALEFPAAYCSSQPDRLVRLRDEMKNLQAARFIQLRMIDLRKTEVTWAIPKRELPLDPDVESKTQKFYYRTIYPIPLKPSTTEENYRKMLRDKYMGRFLTDAYYAVLMLILDQPYPSPYHNRLANPALLPELNDRNHFHEINASESNTVVKMFGLPLSRESRIEGARKRQLAESRFKAIGYPAHREAKLLREAKDRRQCKAQLKADEEHGERLRMMEERKQKHEILQALEEEDEKRERRNQRNRLGRLTAAAKEERKMSRKRAGKEARSRGVEE